MAYALVEIKCDDTLAFYQGYVKDVDRDQVLVAYEGGWQRDAWLNVASLRPALAPYNAAQFNPLPGEVVEVKAKSAEHEPYSWWRGSVKSVRPNPALAALPDSLGSTANQLVYEISYAGWENEFTETLEKEMLRPFNKQLCFTVGDIEKHTLPLAPALAALLTSEVLTPIHYNANSLALFVEAAGTVQPTPPSLGNNANFLPVVTTQPQIIVIGSKPNCQRAVILLANQLKLLNQQQQLQEQQSQFQNQQFGNNAFQDPYGNNNANLQQNNFSQQSFNNNNQNMNQNNRFGDSSSSSSNTLASHHHQSQHGNNQFSNNNNNFGYDRNNNTNRNSYGGHRSTSPLSPFSSNPNSFAAGLPYSAANPPYTLEFHCPPHLMGMVIGKRHKNLYIAENLDGIYKVHVDTENGSIVVLAKTAEAANAARSLLELTEQTLQIPSVIVGRVVGKNFSIIKEIEQHSGVLRIKVGDDRDHDMEYLQNLALHGIPGLQQLDENGNPLPVNPALQAMADKEKADKAEKEKRSAFALSYRDRDSRSDHRFGSRGGRYGDRVGRFGEREEPEKEEEFDIVALEEDKTVEISIIGSPATVSEAELLLRTHIGLITQIYKLSYDEAMLKREVDALSLVVPMLKGGGPPGPGFAPIGGGNPKFEKRKQKDDGFTPAWMIEKDNNAASSSSSGPVRSRKDPSADIHAARLEGKTVSKSNFNAAPVVGASSEAAPSASPDAAGDSSDSDDGTGPSSREKNPRKRGGRKLKEKRMRLEMREKERAAAAVAVGSGAAGEPSVAGEEQKERPERSERRGPRGGRNPRNTRPDRRFAASGDSSVASAPVAASAAPVASE